MASGMIEGKRADSARRRDRVLKALDAALRTEGDITVSGLARTARVDRSFLYRHRDLLARVHAAAGTPVEEGRLATVSRVSLQTDLANALERNARLAARVRQLEKRLSERLGERVWSESGLGAPLDVDELQRRMAMLEQELAEKNGELEERAEETPSSEGCQQGADPSTEPASLSCTAGNVEGPPVAGLAPVLRARFCLGTRCGAGRTPIADASGAAAAVSRSGAGSGGHLVDALAGVFPPCGRLTAVGRRPYPGPRLSTSCSPLPTTYACAWPTAPRSRTTPGDHRWDTA